MKRLIKAVMLSLVIIVAVIFGGFSAYAEEYAGESTAEVSENIDSALEEYGIEYSCNDMESLTLPGFFSSVRKAIEDRIRAPLKLFGAIFAVVIFSSLTKVTGESLLRSNSGANLCSYITIITAVTAITPRVFEVYGNSMTAVEQTGGFMAIFIPLFAGISIMSGGVFSAGAYNAITLFSAELLIELSREFLMPLLLINSALSVVGSIYSDYSLDSLSALIKKVVTWLLTVAVTLFTGFITLKTKLGASTDSFTTKTAKFVISGFVPVVGSAVSDAYTTVKGSFGVMKSTAGTAGIVAILLLLIPPVIEVFAYRTVMWAGSTIAEMFSVKPVEKLLKGIDSGLAIIMSVLICFGVLFTVSTAVLMSSFT